MSARDIGPGPEAGPDRVPEFDLLPEEGSNVGRGWTIALALLGVVALVAGVVGLANRRSDGPAESVRRRGKLHRRTRGAPDDHGGIIDCAAPVAEGALNRDGVPLPSTCVVAVGALADYDQSGIAAVTFDDSVPAPEPPSLFVTPSEGLVDGDLITITVDGVAEDWTWWPQICSSIVPPWVTDGESTSTNSNELAEVWCEPLSDAMEELTSGDVLEVPVSRWFGALSGIEPVDCGSEPGRCWIEVYAGPLPIDPVPLTFDPSVPAGPPPPPPSYVTPEHSEWTEEFPGHDPAAPTSTSVIGNNGS